MYTLTPELLVDDLPLTITWYQSILGFKTITRAPDSDNPTFALLKKGNVEIMLYHRSEFAQEIPAFNKISLGGSLVLYLTVDDIHSLWDSVHGKAEIVQSLHTTTYGSSEFTILDCNGYYLMFSERTT